MKKPKACCGVGPVRVLPMSMQHGFLHTLITSLGTQPSLQGARGFVLEEHEVVDDGELFDMDLLPCVCIGFQTSVS
eukprot:2613481-Amphidinium_carterae.1